VGDSGVYKVAWSPDGSKIAGGTDRQLWIWNANTFEIIQTIHTEATVDALVWTPEGHLFHNGGFQGLYRDGLPVTLNPTAMPTDTPTTPLP
jgi:WD40 repeat protein